MKLTQLKQIIKEEITKLQLKEQALSNWDGNCNNVIPNNSVNDLKDLCMKCSPELTGGENASYDQQLDPSPCDCNLEGMPLMDFCRNKFPNLDLGLGSNTSGGGTSSGTGTSMASKDNAWANQFTTTVNNFKNPEKRKKFLDGRIKGWQMKLTKAGPKYKKQLNQRISVAKSLLNNGGLYSCKTDADCGPKSYCLNGACADGNRPTSSK